MPSTVAVIAGIVRVRVGGVGCGGQLDPPHRTSSVNAAPPLPAHVYVA